MLDDKAERIEAGKAERDSGFVTGEKMYPAHGVGEILAIERLQAFRLKYS